jgi:hypothetical protein
VAAGVSCVALVSVWHSAAPTWHRLVGDHDTFAAYSQLDREQAPAVRAGISGDLFDFFASNLRRGDRVYFQVPRRPYGTLDLHDTIAALGRYFFLPAVEVADPGDATVVVSYGADPKQLHRAFISQVSLGDNHLSRISYP